MSGFWSGFAKGWEAESERIERRKLFQDEMSEKRTATLAEILARRGRSSTNGPGGTGDDATPKSAEHNEQRLLAYGVTPDQIAKASAKGPAGLQAFADTIEETSKNPAALTPATFDTILNGVVVTIDAGETVDPRAFAEELYGAEYAANMSEEDVNFLAATTSTAPSAEVSVAYVPDEPFDVAKSGAIVKQFNENLAPAISQELAMIEDRMSKFPVGPEETQALSDRAATLNTALTELKEGNPVQALQIYGVDKAYENIVKPQMENDPELANAPRGILGIWGMTVPMEFSTEEELIAAYNAGRIPKGVKIFVAGEEVENDF